MKIYYDKEKSMELMQRIEDEFGARSRKTARGTEMHVSDLTGCQCRPYCRISGVPRQTTKQQVGVMVFGIIAETILGWTRPQNELQYQSNFWLLEPNQNIFGHIDVFEDEKHPWEVKASRKSIFKSKDLPVYWVEQLMSYMTIQGAKKGWLILFNVFSTQIMAFRFNLTNEDILGWIVTLNERASKIRKAVNDKDPSNLEINPNQHDWCDYKSTCPRRNECHSKYLDIKAEKRRIKNEKKLQKVYKSPLT